MDKIKIDQLQGIREALIEWALLVNVYELPGTRDFIEDVVTRLSTCHQSFIKDVKDRLVKRKQIKALAQSLNVLIEEGRS